jgi:hypothetical protein
MYGIKTLEELTDQFRLRNADRVAAKVASVSDNGVVRVLVPAMPVLVVLGYHCCCEQGCRCCWWWWW